MPKASLELIARREKEIVDACEKIYRAKGFCGVTIKEISTETSFTRPAIYNYFETKDEILMALLCREYREFCERLESLAAKAAQCTKAALADQIAGALAEREILLRIQSMDLFEIEQNSRLERLVRLKEIYGRTVAALETVPGAYGVSSGEERASCSRTFFAFLFGVHPYVFHTEKQLEAMRIAGISVRGTTVYEMVYQCLLRLIPDQKETAEGQEA